MATVDANARDVANSNELPTGKRKRPVEDDSGVRLTNGTSSISTDQALQSLHNILDDLVQVLQEYDMAFPVLNVEIAPISNKEHTPKRAKTATTSRATTLLAQVNTKAYTTVDRFFKDVQTAVRLVQDRSESPEQSATAARLEDEIVSILNDEISSGTVSLPRSDGSEMLLVSSQQEDGSLDTDANLVLTTPGFVHGLSHTSKRLYSSFRLSSANSKGNLRALPLEQLPNNITASSVRVQKTGDIKGKVSTLRDLFNPTKTLRIDMPRPSSSSAKGSIITWSNSDEQAKEHRSKDRKSQDESQLVTGQWLSYNNSPQITEMPSVEARRRRRDRALSTGEANVDLTGEEKESVRRLQQIYQKAKSDSLYKSLYCSFAPTHDNSGAVVPKNVRSRHWWIKQGAATYLSDSATITGSPFDNDTITQSDELEKQEPPVQDSHFHEMLDTWIDPELIGIPKEKQAVDKDTEEILAEVSHMLQTLSSYQRNRSLTLDHRQQGSTSQNRSLVELQGDTSTPSDSECLLYDTLRDSLASLVASLPPYAVAKLNGAQLGKLNISTKMLVQKPSTKGTMTSMEAQSTNPQPVARSQPAAPVRVPPTPQVSTPTQNIGQNVSHRPLAGGGVYSKYRAAPIPTSHHNYGGQPNITPRASHILQTPSTPVPTLTNGTRPAMNGYSTYSSRVSPQRPSSGSSSRPVAHMPASQTYSTYGANTNQYHSARSSSPQQNTTLPTAPNYRANWNPSNGTIGSMFLVDDQEVSRLEERQKAQMTAQAAQIRQDSTTPRPTSQAMSPISNGTPGA